MRAWISAGLLPAAITAAACGQEGGGLALSGATIIDGTGGAAIEDGVVLVEDGRLACVGAREDCAVPQDAETVDMSGRFITPGLVDAHVHFAQTGWLDGRPDGIDVSQVYPYAETVADLRAEPWRWHASYLCSGITAVFDVGGQAWTVTGEHAADTDRPDRAHVRAAGPLITHADERNRFFMTGGAADRPLFLPMDTDEEALTGVARLEEIGAQAVKVWYLRAPEDRRAELDARLALIGEAASQAGLPLIVHATSLREAKAALRAGASMLVHSVQDRPVDREFLDLLLANEAVYAPTLVVGGNWRRAIATVFFETPAGVDDPNACVDAALMDRIMHPERLTPYLPEQMTAAGMYAGLEAVGAERAQMYDNLMAVYEAGGRIATATDAGNPLTVHGPSIYWEMEAMEAAGLPSEAIIEMSTRSGAIAMDRLDAFGTLEAGKSADLIVLAEDPRETVAHFRSLTHVMRSGVLNAQENLQVREAE